LSGKLNIHVKKYYKNDLEVILAIKTGVNILKCKYLKIWQTKLLVLELFYVIENST